MKKFFTELVNKSRNQSKFSLPNLKTATMNLKKHADTPGPIDEMAVVELLRLICELLIWGDQNDPRFADYFLEKKVFDLIGLFLNRRGGSRLEIQLIQCLSILAQNLSNSHCLFFMFSNDHVNQFIVHKYDFSDDELLAYYVSFLKTISLRLDRNMVQFFYNANEGTFPLYSAVTSFMAHEEAMVRTAVRTALLNIYKVQDPAMRRFLITKSAVVMSDITALLRDQCLACEAACNSGKSSGRVSARLEDATDTLYFTQDLYGVEVEEISEQLREKFLVDFLYPLVFFSLQPSSASNTASVNTLFAPHSPLRPGRASVGATQQKHDAQDQPQDSIDEDAAAAAAAAAESTEPAAPADSATSTSNVNNSGSNSGFRRVGRLQPTLSFILLLECISLYRSPILLKKIVMGFFNKHLGKIYAENLERRLREAERRKIIEDEAKRLEKAAKSPSRAQSQSQLPTVQQQQQSSQPTQPQQPQQPQPQQPPQQQQQSPQQQQPQQLMPGRLSIAGTADFAGDGGEEEEEEEPGDEEVVASNPSTPRKRNSGRMKFGRRKQNGESPTSGPSDGTGGRASIASSSNGQAMSSSSNVVPSSTHDDSKGDSQSDSADPQFRDSRETFTQGDEDTSAATATPEMDRSEDNFQDAAASMSMDEPANVPTADLIDIYGNDEQQQTQQQQQQQQAVRQQPPANVSFSADTNDNTQQQQQQQQPQQQQDPSALAASEAARQLMLSPPAPPAPKTDEILFAPNLTLDGGNTQASPQATAAMSAPRSTAGTLLHPSSAFEDGSARPRFYSSPIFSHFGDNEEPLSWALHNGLTSDDERQVILSVAVCRALMLNRDIDPADLRRIGLRSCAAPQSSDDSSAALADGTPKSSGTADPADPSSYPDELIGILVDLLRDGSLKMIGCIRAIVSLIITVASRYPYQGPAASSSNNNSSNISIGGLYHTSTQLADSTSSTPGTSGRAHAKSSDRRSSLRRSSSIQQQQQQGGGDSATPGTSRTGPLQLLSPRHIRKIEAAYIDCVKTIKQQNAAYHLNAQVPGKERNRDKEDEWFLNLFERAELNDQKEASVDVIRQCQSAAVPLLLSKNFVLDGVARSDVDAASTAATGDDTGAASGAAAAAAAPGQYDTQPPPDDAQFTRLTPALRVPRTPVEMLQNAVEALLALRRLCVKVGAGAGFPLLYSGPVLSMSSGFTQGAILELPQREVYPCTIDKSRLRNFVKDDTHLLIVDPEMKGTSRGSVKLSVPLVSIRIGLDRTDPKILYIYNRFATNNLITAIFFDNPHMCMSVRVHLEQGIDNQKKIRIHTIFTLLDIPYRRTSLELNEDDESFAGGDAAAAAGENDGNAQDRDDDEDDDEEEEEEEEAEELVVNRTSRANSSAVPQ